MKIAAIQTNPVIGDFSANTSAMLNWIGLAKEAGCQLAIFPEMVVSGYPPQDLLERPAFVAAHHKAVLHLQKKSSLSLIFGSITSCPAATGKPLHNSATLSTPEGHLSVHKQLLPTYDVFDESRYFEPGTTSQPLQFMGKTLGITICEDVFNDPTLSSPLLIEDVDTRSTGPSTPYRRNPVQDLFDQSETELDMLINIAASPFHSGKPEAKQAFFAQLARRHHIPFIYVNQVGGQDSLIFDGQSLIIDGKGNFLAKAPPFAEAMIVFDTDTNTAQVHETYQVSRRFVRPAGPADTTAGAANAAIVFEALVCGTRDYLKKCGFNKAVVGLSGGIDSALTAAIAAEALGPENVLGVALPSPYTSAESIEDARQVAENLGTAFEILPISDIFSSYLATLSPFFKGLPEDTTEQNIQARIRGNLLMAIANKFGYLLLSTGNKSEMAVGYCTLYGDMSGGLAVISDVPKMLVYRICRYLNELGEIIPLRTISKAPTAELVPNQKDQDDLPPYEILDQILELYLEKKCTVANIIQRGFEAEIVRDIVRRIIANEHKRKQAPMGLKVTSKAFGYGRRYPTTQNFREND
jgi:NAD+ synthetase